MKSTGIVRKIDELGRITLPMELRRTLGIELRDPMEISVEGERIILKKYAPGCTLCGRTEKLTSLYPGKDICAGCVNIIVKDQEKLQKEIQKKVS